MDERQTQINEEEKMRPIDSRPLQMSQPYPWLVITNEADTSYQIFYSVSRKSCFKRSIPEMQNKLIVSSQKGWQFLQENEDENENGLSLFNIFTLEKIQLPPLSIDIGEGYDCVLSSCTETKLENDCRVLVISGCWSRYRYCHLGDSEFVEKYFKQRLSYRDGFIGPVINYEGKLYALVVECYDLFVADFADPDLLPTRVIEGHKSISQILIPSDDTEWYLIESGGLLLFVFTNHLYSDGLDIKIYKADFAKKEWVNLDDHDLDDRALFLDYYKGLSSSSKSGEFGLRCNCVYYVNKCDKHLYCYDLKNGRITMSSPYPEVSDENSSLHWAM